jgi:tRNA threonylcarbamoyladenosine biosynthesis protein TsaB
VAGRLLTSRFPEVLLALDTSTVRTSVALLVAGQPVAEAAAAVGVHTAECLLPTLDTVLREAGVALEAVDAFAVTLGPGSFTGLRIGLATLKGFALGTARPAVGISSLAALAAAAPAGAGPVLATLDARRGELYAGAFADPGVRVADVLPEGLFAPEQLAGRFGACRVVGEGAQVCGEALARALPAAVFCEGDPWPHARDVARLAWQALGAGEGSDPAALAPRYVRRAQAEVVRTGEATEPGPAL